MNTQHTPGPWAVDGQYIRSSQFHLAIMTRPDSGMMAEWRANRNLIAAAPDLLEAVLLAHKYMGIVNFDYEESSEQDQDLHTETYLTIQDAIAKAIGQIP